MYSFYFIICLNYSDIKESIIISIAISFAVILLKEKNLIFCCTKWIIKDYISCIMLEKSDVFFPANKNK